MKSSSILNQTLLAALLLAVSASVAQAGFEGNSNTFYGTGAGTNTAGDNDGATFVGASAGHNNTTGYDNTFLGQWAGTSNTTGSYNTFTGWAAGIYNTTGHDNTFLGFDAACEHS
jgi:hypothetical protein